jgi:trigger factor
MPRRHTEPPVTSTARKNPSTDWSLRVVPPALEDLEVEVTPPEPVTDVEIISRLGELRFLHAARAPRASGEAVAEGDEAVVDVVGRCDGALLPFSAREDELLWVEEPDGLGRAILGWRVGDRKTLDQRVRDDYPVPALRGRLARFDIRVKAAAAVTLPNPTAPEFLRALGHGDTLKDALAGVNATLQEERVLRVRLEATRGALEQVVARTKVEVPEGLVDLEIGLAWRENEGAVLERMAAPGERDDALRGWLNEPRMRAETQARIATTLTLRAIAEREGLAPDQAKMNAEIGRVVDALGLGRRAIRGGSDGDALTYLEAAERLNHLAAVAHVMKHVTIRFKKS